MVTLRNLIESLRSLAANGQTDADEIVYLAGMKTSYNQRPWMKRQIYLPPDPPACLDSRQVTLGDDGRPKLQLSALRNCPTHGTKMRAVGSIRCRDANGRCGLELGPPQDESVWMDLETMALEREPEDSTVASLVSPRELRDLIERTRRNAEQVEEQKFRTWLDLHKAELLDLFGPAEEGRQIPAALVLDENCKWFAPFESGQSILIGWVESDGCEIGITRVRESPASFPESFLEEVALCCALASKPDKSGEFGPFQRLCVRALGKTCLGNPSLLPPELAIEVRRLRGIRYRKVLNRDVCSAKEFLWLTRLLIEQTDPSKIRVKCFDEWKDVVDQRESAKRGTGPVPGKA